MRRIFPQYIFPESNEPIRAEIFAIARLKDHAESLAHAQKITSTPQKGKDLTPRMRENRKILEDAYHSILHAVKGKHAITSAAEWLLDNFHIIRAQLKDIRDHLPPKFYRELPKISEGTLAGFPRVYGIAWAFVAHTDSNFDPELFKVFVSAYQKVQPLTIGELWALPITLRLVLIENLRRISDRVVKSQKMRLQANQIADAILGVGKNEKLTVKEVIRSLQKQPLQRSFAVQLLQRIRFHESRVGLLHKYLDERMIKEGQAIESWVIEEHKAQSTANVTTRNIITSCRLVSQIDWSEFFEEVSIVDQILREKSYFATLDFTTRDRYRHRIEKLARYSPLTEIQVAKAIAADPGHHLIGFGELDFEKSIAFKANFYTKFLRWYTRNGNVLYLGSIFTLALLASLAILFLSIRGNLSTPLLFLLFPLVLLLTSEIAIAFVNKVTTTLFGPKNLPRLQLKAGLSDKYKTSIVVPTMFTDVGKIRKQLEQVEIHYLSNQDHCLYLALLTDFADSLQETDPADQQIIETAARELRLLNDRYPVATGHHPRFSIYHRRRVFNRQENCWMGWERKRGKLDEFNRLLLGAKDTTFQPLSGVELRVPQDIRYVITLDADTKLPRGSVAQLVGTMAHPLNRPVFDEKLGRVVAGYGILQPRITPSLPTRKDNTIFRKLTAGVSGIDPYASAVSDVYQDLFGEGSFTGKGIYDLAIFTKCMQGKIAENSVLSHDLLEGNFARCGFLSDVELVEDFPSHIAVATQRMHRWIRGDWQLLPWIFTSRGSSLSLIGRWKMFDNLRRSIIPPISLILFFVALILPGIIAWPLFAILALSLLSPSLLSLWSDLWPKRLSKSKLQHFFMTYDEFRTGISHAFLSLALLPQSAWTSIDAISRALYRFFISRKNLLEWTTAEQSAAAANHELPVYFKSMRGALLLVTLGLIAVFFFTPPEQRFILPVIALWFALPLLARHLSLPPKAYVQLPISADDSVLLHTTARKIWRFFGKFVSAEDNYLPPDNFQEDPKPVVAHRSSPTNFGLYLLSIFAAKDFGWIGMSEAVNRLEQTFDSLLQLPRHEGHFYNWYDTINLHPLEPRYISSVDNGNLTGHLFAVAQGCAELLAAPVNTLGCNPGIFETLYILEQELKKYTRKNLKVSKKFENLNEILIDLSERLKTPDEKIENTNQHWKNLCAQTNLLVKQATIFAGEPLLPERSDIQAWCLELQNDVQSSAQDFFSLASWSDFIHENLFPDASHEDHQWWSDVRQTLNRPIPLAEMDKTLGRIHQEIITFKKNELMLRQSLPKFIDPLLLSLTESIAQAKTLVQKIKKIRLLSYQFIHEMDFKLLYDFGRKLFSIGMNVEENKLDTSYYDLLASEARLTSFIAIAKGDIPVSHWFHLGRNLIDSKHGKILASWSGSMFEYLMPCLVMRSPEGTLLDETCHRAVKHHIDYGQTKNVPWGISESAYNNRDFNLAYQYSSFGLPDLGLKTGLGDQLVIAPYATLLATIYEPALAAKNLLRLEKMHASGTFGFYEAVDFTASRLPKGRSHAIVKTYMAHHQGMALVTLANVFKNSCFKRRFHSDPSILATELLLQERTPRIIETLPTPKENIHIEAAKELIEHVSRRYRTVNHSVPKTQLLSNGHYMVMLTSAGSGFSRLNDIAVTRWREDATCDNHGSYFYLKDCFTGDVWSAGHQPVCADADRYEAMFYEDQVQICRFDHDISTKLSISVSPVDNAEVRQLSITNKSSSVREIEITSYSEIVLNTQAADVAHPAFSNLFVESEFRPELLALIASRRPRSIKDKKIWMTHVLRADRHAVGSIQYETSRVNFIGRNRSVRNPAAIFNNVKLSGTVGAVLDPILSLRTRVRLGPGKTTILTFSTAVAETREEIEILAEKFYDPTIFGRVSDLAWTQGQIRLHHLGIEPDEAHLFQRLATRLFFSDSSLRAPSEVLKENCKNVNGLWALGISGDHPIVLVRIDDIEDRNLIRQLLKAQIYLATKGYISDLLILNEGECSYNQELQRTLEQMAQSAHLASGPSLDSSKVFVIRGDLLAQADHVLLAAEARVILSTRHGSLSDQVKRTHKLTRSALKKVLPINQVRFIPTLPKLDFFNGHGGFTKDGNEYAIILKNHETTPAPWINVIANPEFGFQVSESGAGYTWAANSRENQLTPWSNDPVCDPSGEAIFIYDCDNSMLWSPTSAPIRLAKTTYITYHGQGYSRFENQSFDICTKLQQFVLPDLPVKISRLQIENKSRGVRRLAITGYLEWVLGFSRAAMAPTILTELDESSQAIFATNPRELEHGTKIAFHCLLQGHTSFTCDRGEFIGRNSDLSQPRALLTGKPLQSVCGGGADPCASLQKIIEIKPGEKAEIVFIIGQTEDRQTARNIIGQVKNLDLDNALEKVRLHWEDLLGKVQVETPDRSFDLMINRWYLYQTIVCRLWARAAFYQAGGAFGFRDQLQDVLALTISSPQMAREQILRAASRQFIEGDVQHWWHPPKGRGVRTHFSDDLLWLPYVVNHYLQVTQDFAILEEPITFIEGDLLPANQEDAYFTPTTSSETASLYQHCARALDYSLKTGAHGLPLMGTGDWNDGMNQVGAKGLGESVWLAWFLHENLQNFAPLAETSGEAERGKIWIQHAKKLIKSIEKNAWDGSWYRRAFYDDGTPLGTVASAECQIDSLAQTWAVISGAGQATRAKKAMRSVYKHLVKEENNMILLFTPPFDQTKLDPGYIKGYLPGVRENGGQYTHAATWVVIATALLGEGKLAHDLFSFLNPIHHSGNQTQVNRYKIEPYVAAADVYSQTPNIGRGGWSWYTGAAGWLYRSGVEYLLGLQVSGNQLTLKPCVPAEWKRFKIQYKHHSSLYIIHIKIEVEKILEAKKIYLVDDGGTHKLNIKFGHDES